VFFCFVRIKIIIKNNFNESAKYRVKRSMFYEQNVPDERVTMCTYIEFKVSYLD